MNRKLILTFVAVLTMTACSNQESIETAPVVPTVLKSKVGTRSYEDAVKIAENAISMLENSNTSTRSAENRRKIDFSENKVIVNDKKTRGDSEGIDSLIYVFNFENDEGFALVSASENTEGLLAVTEQGHCDPKELSGIDGFDMFLGLAKKYVSDAPNGLKGNGSEYLTDEVRHYTTVGPFVSVKWGQTQNKVEGELFSNGIAGCANIALAQIMKYFEYPSSIYLTYADADINSISLPWANMKTHNNGKTHTESFLSAVCNNMTAHKAIARLIRQLGELNHSYPYNGETITLRYYIKPTMNSLGYSVDTKTVQKARAEIDKGHLLFVSGFYDSSEENGHAWIMDGYKKEVIVQRIMEAIVIGGKTTWVVKQESVLGTTYYNHFNWGMYGFYNGYFSENVYNQESVKWPESSINVGGHNYKYGVRYMSIYR